MALSGIIFLSTEYLEVIFGREGKCFRKQVVFINIGNLNSTQRNYLQELQRWQRLTDTVSSFCYHCIYLHDSKGSSSTLAFFEWMWRIVGNSLSFWENCKRLSCQVMRDESRRGMHFELKLRPCSHFLVWTSVHLPAVPQTPLLPRSCREKGSRSQKRLANPIKFTIFSISKCSSSPNQSQAPLGGILNTYEKTAEVQRVISIFPVLCQEKGILGQSMSIQFLENKNNWSTE